MASDLGERWQEGTCAPPSVSTFPIFFPLRAHLMMALPPVRPSDCSVVLCKAALPVTCKEGTGQLCPGHPLTPR